MPMPPAPPKSHHPRPTASDIERMSEKYWGEILERTLSSTSLHRLQQSFNGPPSQGHTIRTPLVAHHNNRFNHSASLLSGHTSILSLNHIARDNGFDSFRNSDLRHSCLDDMGHHRLRATEATPEAEDGDEVDEEDEEDGEEEGDEEDVEAETSNSDSVQEERPNGPRVSFLSNSETRLNDFTIHDKNCAKAKALNAQIQSIKGLPAM